MSSLRLVGGADGRTSREVKLDQARAAEIKSQEDMVAFARKAIRQHLVGSEGMTVSQFLNEFNKICASEAMPSPREQNIQFKLGDIGIGVGYVDNDLDKDVYGYIQNKRQLLKAIPSLEPAESVLLEVTL